MSKDKVARIRELNDAFRTSGLGGKFVLTNGVGSLGVETVGKSIEAVKAFDAFTTDNDPYGEHDFGSLDVEGHRLFWKIDYYGLVLFRVIPTFIISIMNILLNSPR